MSLETFLNRMREKPEHIKKRYSFAISFLVTVIIFTFWINSFDFMKGSRDKAVASVVSKVGSPSQSLLASVGSFFVDIKDIVFGPKKVNYSSVEVTPGRK